MSITKKNAFMIGICIGLLVNSLFATNLLAAAAVSNQPVPIGPPQPYEEYTEVEYTDYNEQLYSLLFPGDVFDNDSYMSVDSPMIVEGRNDGLTDTGELFSLQVFVVDEFDVADVELSLTEAEEALWVSGGVQAAVFTGLMSSEATGWSVAVPVVGWVSSSNVNQDARIWVMATLDPVIGDAMIEMWYARSIYGTTESFIGDWDFSLDICGLGVG